MILFKGDRVRIRTGETGEVLETWGKARDWVRVLLEDGRSVPLFVSDIKEVVRRKPTGKQNRSV